MKGVFLMVFMLNSLTWSLAQTNKMALGTNFWNIEWGIRDDVFKSGVNWSTTTDPWNPQFISELGIYKCLRPMDFVPTNGSIVSNWSQRLQKTSDHSTSPGVAYEWQIDLCNRINADLWTTIPHLATDDYIKQLATLIKANLKPNLKVYVEWSNETWNMGFEQAKYAAQQGIVMNLPGDDYSKLGGYQTISAIKCWKLFHEIYGSEMSARVVKVLAGQDGNDYLAGVHVNILNSVTYNPGKIMPDVYTVAPYIGHNFRGDDPDIIAKLIAEIPKSVANNQIIKNRFSALGIGFVGYEGGQHIADYSSFGNNSQIANRLPGMYDFYKQYLDAYNDIFTLFIHYLHSGVAGSQGSWGSLEYVGQPISQAHKYRALVDFANQGQVVDNQAPSVPTNVSLSSKTTNTASITWTASTDNIGVIGYDVYNGGTKVNSSLVTTTDFKITGLSPSATYTFTVKSKDGAGNMSVSSNILTVTTLKTPAPTEAKKTLGGVVIDGLLNENSWTHNYPIANTLSTTSNNSVTFDVVWDNTYLYIAANVTDANLFNDSPDRWDDDALEFFVDANNNKGTVYDAYDRQFVKRYMDPTIWEQGNKTTGVLHAYAKTPEGYAIEIAIPWTNLGESSSPSAGKLIGFDIANDDDDNGAERDAQMIWNGTGNNYATTADFGTIVLSENTVGPDVVAGLENITSGTKGKVYPAPSINYVKVNLLGESIISYQVHDKVGREIQVSLLDRSQNELNLNTESLLPGIYYITVVRSSGNNQILTIVKQ